LAWAVSQCAISGPSSKAYRICLEYRTQVHSDSYACTLHKVDPISVLKNRGKNRGKNNNNNNNNNNNSNNNDDDDMQTPALATCF
jgi:hypothetical protein